MTPRDRVRDVVSGPYREIMIDGAGHWLAQERPDEVTAALLDFLAPSIASAPTHLTSSHPTPTDPR
jgi:hypothetical protein